MEIMKKMIIGCLLYQNHKVTWSFGSIENEERRKNGGESVQRGKKEDRIVVWRFSENSEVLFLRYEIQPEKGPNDIGLSQTKIKSFPEPVFQRTQIH